MHQALRPPTCRRAAPAARVPREEEKAKAMPHVLLPCIVLVTAKTTSFLNGTKSRSRTKTAKMLSTPKLMDLHPMSMDLAAMPRMQTSMVKARRLSPQCTTIPPFLSPKQKRLCRERIGRIGRFRPVSRRQPLFRHWLLSQHRQGAIESARDRMALLLSHSNLNGPVEASKKKTLTLSTASTFRSTPTHSSRPNRPSPRARAVRASTRRFRLVTGMASLRARRITLAGRYPRQVVADPLCAASSLICQRTVRLAHPVRTRRLAPVRPVALSNLMTTTAHRRLRRRNSHLRLALDRSSFRMKSGPRRSRIRVSSCPQSHPSRRLL